MTEQEQTQQRRRAAYTELIRQHESALLRAAYRFTLGNEAEAQDLVQETLVRGYEAYLEGRFQEGTFARAWLMKILTNRFLNDRRALRWRADLEGDAEDGGCGGIEAFPASAEEQPERFLLSGTLDEPLERALASLSPELRLCVTLVDIEEFSYEEAAKVFQIPIGTVRSRLFRARRQLYFLLRDYAQEHRRA